MLVSRIFFTGDCHGYFQKFSSKNFLEGKELTRDDFVIVLGDVALQWKIQENSNEKHWREWLNNKPWTTLYVLGNHENFDRIEQLPTINKFGGKVRVVDTNIFILMNGEIYTIDNKKFFVMGGALSIDKDNRISGISWWRQEIPSNKEFEHGLSNLEKHNNKVDYILGHTAPQSVIEYYLNRLELKGFTEKYDTVAKYFDNIVQDVDFKTFYFGHMHDDIRMTVNEKNYYLLYDRIVELT